MPCSLAIRLSRQIQAAVSSVLKRYRPDVSMQVPADGAASKQHGNELKTAHAEQQAQKNRSRGVLEAAND